MTEFTPFLHRVAAGERLSAGDATAAFDLMMNGDASEMQMAAFLMGLRMRGETVDEITGAVTTMRAKMLKVPAPAGAMDIVGTGGDAKGTYNVSTCTAFVVAGAGIPVAKHGNRSVSSRSGAADVLKALGVNVDIDPKRVGGVLEKAGIAFMFAPAHHAAMRHVGPVRQALAMRTIFNLLGPLSNPAGTKRQVVGVFAREWVEPLAHVLNNLGAEKIWVVHGADGLDELTTTGPTHVAELAGGQVRTFDVVPGDAGLEPTELSALLGGEAPDNAAAIREVLGGARSAFRDIVLLNAAAAFVVADRAATLSEGAALAAQVIDSGQAKARLEGLVAATNAG